MIKGLVSDRNGMLVSGGWDKFRLAAGTYHLIETQAPEGYILKTDPVVITVNAEGVTYDEQTALGSNGRGVTYEENVYLLLISNSRGFELPSTGSSETIVRAFIGASLVLVSAVMLFQHRRKLMDER
jgi:LPXTG-motif cell wall-anchored protein